MARPTLARVASTLRATARRQADVPDADHDLLARFVQSREDAAFRALVNRHGQTVLTACRQVLTDPADIDDAFQAAFLVLLRKAKAVDAATPLGGWLFAVAHRVAVRCRSDKARRRVREAEAARRNPTTEQPDLSWREAAAVLHAELNALPDRYRLPLLLCGVQGLTRDEAAEQLGTTVGAVRGQLERGRALLERRLTRRGVVLSAGLLAVLVGGSRAAGGPSPELIDLAVSATTGNASSAVASLARGAFPMSLTSKRLLLPLLLAGALALAGHAAFRFSAATAGSSSQRAETPPEPAKPVADDANPEFVYAGRVLGPAGKPQAGAKIHMCGLNRGTVEFAEKAETDADGRFRFSVRKSDFVGRADREPGAHVSIGATAPGCGPAVRFAGKPEEREKLTLWLAPERVVKARVVDTEGKPVAGVKLDVSIVAARYAKDGRPTAYDAEREDDGWTANVMPEPAGKDRPATDADGRCELRGLGDGWLYYLWVSGPGVVSAKAKLVAREQPAKLVNGLGMSTASGGYPKITEYGCEFVHVTEKAKPIVGVVRDQFTGKPVAGVPVSRDWVRDGEAYAHATSDADGKFRLDGLPPGQHTLTLTPPPPYLRTRYLAAADQPGTKPFECAIDLKPNSLVRGRVTDVVTGKPVRGSVAYFPFADNPALKDAPLLATESWPPRTITADLDGEGRYVLPALPGRGVILAQIQGPYRPARVAEADRARGTVDRTDPELFDTRPRPTWVAGHNAYKLIEVADGKNVTCDLTVEPGRALPLVVTDPAGKPVATRVLGLKPEPEDAAADLKTGRGTIGALADGERRPLYLRASDPSQSLAAFHQLGGDEKGTVTVKLRPTGSITGRLLDAAGKPLAGEHFQIAYAATDRAAGVAVTKWRTTRLLTTAEGERERRVRGYLERDDDGMSEEKTDAEGRFRIDGVVPGAAFDLRVQLTKPSSDPKGGRTIIGLRRLTAATVESGEVKELGDLKADAAKDRGE